jgi:hypothetical protein
MARQQEAIDTVAKACAFGDFEKLKHFVLGDPGVHLRPLRAAPCWQPHCLLAPAACVNRPDDSGYFPLQWAALNNRVAEATFLLSHGAAVNSADHTGQTALHWAAVRGSLPVIETLLRNGGCGPEGTVSSSLLPSLCMRLVAQLRTLSTGTTGATQSLTWLLSMGSQQ